MSDDELFTLNECLAMMARVWDAFEHSALEQAAADARAQGFPEADVRRVLEETARLLRAGRPARLETARQMLEARATSLQ